jgi:hypothetical protein
VVWAENCIIVVLNQIQVDPPYTEESCKIVGPPSGQAKSSLERVQKIVAATDKSASANSSSSAAAPSSGGGSGSASHKE